MCSTFRRGEAAQGSQALRPGAYTCIADHASRPRTCLFHKGKKCVKHWALLQLALCCAGSSGKRRDAHQRAHTYKQRSHQNLVATRSIRFSVAKAVDCQWLDRGESNTVNSRSGIFFRISLLFFVQDWVLRQFIRFHIRPAPNIVLPLKHFETIRCDSRKSD